MSFDTKNLRSPENGKEVCNQIVTCIHDMFIFTSYRSNIAFLYDGIIYRNEHYVSYLKTTEKYFGVFCDDYHHSNIKILKKRDFNIMLDSLLTK